jgi:hypothetical protein
MIAEHFNDKNYELRKASDQVLTVTISAPHIGTIYTIYDFAARVMYTRTGSSDGGISVTPFDQMDRESVGFFHQKLKDLDGNPPPLPWTPQKQAKPATGNQLNL